MKFIPLRGLAGKELHLAFKAETGEEIVVRLKNYDEYKKFHGALLHSAIELWNEEMIKEAKSFKGMKA